MARRKAKRLLLNLNRPIAVRPAPRADAHGVARSLRQEHDFEASQVCHCRISIPVLYRSRLSCDGLSPRLRGRRRLPERHQGRTEPGALSSRRGFLPSPMQVSIFDKAMAGVVRLTRIDLAWVELFIQLLSLAAILWAGRGIARKLFVEIRAQWAAVAMLAAMFTLPVAGTALFIVDQHLHPRNLATALTAIAVWRIVENKTWQAIPCLALGFAMHPIMGAMGISFAFFTWLIYLEARRREFFGKWRKAYPAARWQRFRSLARRIRHGGRRSKASPTCSWAGGSGTNGWAHWRRWFFSGCLRVLPAGAANSISPVSRRQYLRLGSFSRQLLSRCLRRTR